MEPVASEPRGHDRVVVRPDAPVVVADRVEARHRRRQRAHAPPGEHLGRHEQLRDARRLVLVEDAGPQAVPHVGRKRIEGTLVAVEAHRQPAAILQPEVPVEALLQHSRLAAQRRDERRVAGLLREVRACEVRRVHVALHLAERDRGLCEPPVGEARAVEGVLPALVLEPAIGGALVFHVAVAVAVAELLDPVEGAVGGGQERVDRVAPIAPAAELAEQHHEEGRRVDAPVVDAPAAERQLGRLAEAHLVENAAGLLLGDRIHLAALVQREGLERAQREVAVDEHRHPRREQGVAPEEGHEPRRAGGHDGALGVVGIEEPQRGQVLGGAGDEGGEGVVISGDRREVAPPGLEPGRRRGALDRLPAQVARRDLLTIDRRGELHARGPRATRRHDDVEHRMRARQLRSLGERESRAAPERPALVRPVDSLLADMHVQVAGLLDASLLHLEQVGEVRGDGELEHAPRWLGSVVMHREVLAHPTTDPPVAEDHQLGVGLA